MQRVTGSSKDLDLSDDPQFAAPTANYFMGMYEAHWGLAYSPECMEVEFSELYIQDTA